MINFLFPDDTTRDIWNTSWHNFFQQTVDNSLYSWSTVSPFNCILTYKVTNGFQIILIPTSILNAAFMAHFLSRKRLATVLGVLTESKWYFSIHSGIVTVSTFIDVPFELKWGAIGQTSLHHRVSRKNVWYSYWDDRYRKRRMAEHRPIEEWNKVRMQSLVSPFFYLVNTDGSSRNVSYVQLNYFLILSKAEYLYL